MDKTVIVVILIVIVLGIGFFAWRYKPAPQVPTEPAPMPEGIVFFYGNICFHCKNVEDFVAQNSIADKVKFTSLEVFDNQANAQLLVNTAVSCGVDVSQGAPVPLLWDGSKCYVGEVESIDFFKNAANIQ